MILILRFLTDRCHYRETTPIYATHYLLRVGQYFSDTVDLNEI